MQSTPGGAVWLARRP